MINNRFGKTIAAAALSLSIGFSAATVALPAQEAHAASASTNSKLVSIAKAQLGKPYKFGASTGTTRNFDCSSFTTYVLKHFGVKNLPRTSNAQSKAGKYVSKKNLKVGDLVFFYSPVHHVGIYIGGGKVIHTYGKPGVMISSINSGWWSDHYTTARRFL